MTLMGVADWSVISSNVTLLVGERVWVIALACESFLIPSFDNIINILYVVAKIVSKNSGAGFFSFFCLFNWIPWAVLQIALTFVYLRIFPKLISL